MLVTKRNGTQVPYEREKIIKAVDKAIYEVDGELNPQISNHILESIEEVFKDLGIVATTVEDIQNMVEEALMDVRPDIARSYIRYRYKREMARERYNSLMDAVAEKLNASNVQNQNANVDEHSFGGRMGEMNSLVSKQYALEYLVSPMAKENHLNNEIYIHDLDNYAVGSHNCLTIPFDKLLAEGFNTRQTDVRPAQSISTAFQLVAVIFQLQSLNQFGGVSASHIDWTMVPYVRKSFAKHLRDGIEFVLGNKEYSLNVPKELPFDDMEANDPRNKPAYDYAIKMTEKEVYQAVEAMYHNLNTLQSRSGNQLK